MTWIKKVIYKHKVSRGTIERYEYTKGDYTIDVNIGSEQGFPGSNMVSVLGGKMYGGWLLGTPKLFKTKSQAQRFVEYSKIMLDKGKEGVRVSYGMG